MDIFKVGLLGVGGRASAFADVCREYNKHMERRKIELELQGDILGECKNVEVVAICDNNPIALKNVVDVRHLENINQYLDYDKMLENEKLDLVVVATPIDLHYEHCVKALERDINVMGEVPACGTLEQCKKLVEAEKKSKGTYVFAENACYFKSVLIINEMVKQGVFGDVYYAEGEYIHNLKYLTEKMTKWRYNSMYGRNGIVYGTHSLGPILSWFDFDKIAKVSCVGSGRRFCDPSGQPFNLETTTVMMAKTVNERLIKIKNDFASYRPGTNQYVLQGEKAAFESKRPLPNGDDFVWIKDLMLGTEERWWMANEAPNQWLSLQQLGLKYLPQKAKEWEQFAVTQGHDGADVLMFVDLLESLMNGEKPYLDIHRGMDITIPCIMSQYSIENNGEWVDVPDSRTW